MLVAYPIINVITSEDINFGTKIFFSTMIIIYIFILEIYIFGMIQYFIFKRNTNYEIIFLNEKLNEYHIVTFTILSFVCLFLLWTPLFDNKNIIMIIGMSISVLCVPTNIIATIVYMNNKNIITRNKIVSFESISSYEVIAKNTGLEIILVYKNGKKKKINSNYKLQEKLETLNIYKI